MFENLIREARDAKETLKTTEEEIAKQTDADRVRIKIAEDQTSIHLFYNE